MPDTDIVYWLQTRSFYAWLILALVGLGLALALGQRRRQRGKQGRKPSALAPRPARRRSAVTRTRR